MIIAVDFDGTCTTHEYPRIGRDVGAVPVLRRLVANGHRIILWTMRSGKELEEAVQWFLERNIPLFGVNRNPDQKRWTKSPKPYAQLYIDDSALGCPLRTSESTGESLHVDWEVVERMIFSAAEGTSPADGRSTLIPLPWEYEPVQPRGLLAKLLLFIGANG